MLNLEKVFYFSQLIFDVYISLSSDVMPADATLRVVMLCGPIACEYQSWA